MILGSDILWLVKLPDLRAALVGVRDNLDEFKKLHLIDRIWQRVQDRRYLREKIRVCAHKGVSHGGPVIESMI